MKDCCKCKYEHDVRAIPASCGCDCHSCVHWINAGFNSNLNARCEECRKKETWEEKFDRGFSFEGNNDPNDTPKMMFIDNFDGTKSLAKPEYFKAFIREALSSQMDEVVRVIRRRPVLHHEFDEDLIDKQELLEILANRE